MKHTKGFTIALAALLFMGAAFGQTTLGSTTLSAAVTANAQQITVASATGITASSGGIGLTYLFVDGELMIVDAVNSTTITVQRGQMGTQATSHVTSSVVWRGPPNFFSLQAPVEGAQCVRTNLRVVPIIVVPSGQSYDCLGVTTAGRYVRTSSPGIPVFGSTVASATSITPTGTLFTVSGTTAIATIVVPAGWRPGMCLDIIPSGIFATTTADNIGLVTSASVVGRVLRMCWNGTDWYPSYVS